MGRYHVKFIYVPSVGLCTPGLLFFSFSKVHTRKKNEHKNIKRLQLINMFIK